jgi:guanine deaminase
MNNIDDKAIKLAIQESQINKENNYKKGGPFGAVIVKNGKIITSAHNTVIESIDPTAHAEINAIRQASMILKTNDLSECILYTSTEPCPMCLSAIIWSNIKEIYYANTKKDANDIGFRDDIIYDYINGKKQDILKRHHIKSEEALEVFKEFQDIEDKTMY